MKGFYQITLCLTRPEGLGEPLIEVFGHTFEAHWVNVDGCWG